MEAADGQSTARAVALGVLERVLHGSYLSPVLSAALDASGLGGADRSFVTDLTYGVLRRLMQVDGALAPLLKSPHKLPPRVRGALRLGTYEVLHRSTPRYAAVNAWVGLVKRESPRLAGLVNAVLRRVELQESAAPHLSASLPQWLLSEFDAALGAVGAQEAAQGMLEPEPLWLTLFGEAATSLLAGEGVQLEPLLAGATFPASYRVRSPLPLAQLAAYRAGLVQPQNPSSLQVALALGAGPGHRVYDLASGRGVKTAALAALGAEVTAFELSAARTEAARTNLKRLGLNAHHVVADLLTAQTVPPAPFVVLDAPCSGTGTLRGHPEIKLRLGKDDVEGLAALQKRLLVNAATLVEPGGVLLYAVCSLTQLEGPLVVRHLLEQDPAFREEPAPLPLHNVAPAGGEPLPGRYIVPTGGLDGFYLARLRRAA